MPSQTHLVDTAAAQGAPSISLSLLRRRLGKEIPLSLLFPHLIHWWQQDCEVSFPVTPPELSDYKEAVQRAHCTKECIYWTSSQRQGKKRAQKARVKQQRPEPAQRHLLWAHQLEPSFTYKSNSAGIIAACKFKLSLQFFQLQRGAQATGVRRLSERKHSFAATQPIQVSVLSEF